MSGRSRTDDQVARRDLQPLPVWQQWWRRTRDRRQNTVRAFMSALGALVGLAISAAGAILISFGVYQVYSPAGWVTGGLMCWVLQWSHERDKGGGRG